MPRGHAEGVMSSLRELPAIAHRQELVFLVPRLADVSDPTVDRAELLSDASRVAHMLR